MAKKTWDEVCKNALGMLYEDQKTPGGKYAYFYGAKGQILTSELMDYLISASPNYFKKYSSQELSDLKRWSLGKVGYDCSGFVGAVTGCKTYSKAQWSYCTNKTDVFSGKAGSIVYTTFGGTGSHIGIDIGYGFTLSMDKEGKGICIHRHKDETDSVKWEASGELTYYVDYTGADNR